MNGGAGVMQCGASDGRGHAGCIGKRCEMSSPR